MADIPGTNNITIWDDTETRNADVNANEELLVHDADVLSAIQNITITDAWEGYVQNNQGYAIGYTATLASKDPTDFILLKNPTGSGKNLIIKRFGFAAGSQTGVNYFAVYKNPTVTSDGTGLTEVNLKDVTVTGVGQAFHTPTISARGTYFYNHYVSSLGNNLISVDFELGIYIEPGKYLLVMVDPDSNNIPFSVNLLWAEATI